MQPSLPTTYKRLVAKHTGRSFREVAEVVEDPLPVPGPNEVLIKLKFAGINGGCETFRARGEYAFAGNKSKPQFSLGAEGAGIVAAVGPGVSSLSVGQAVACNSAASFAEYGITQVRAAGGTGHFAVQLAQLAGARVVAVTGSASKKLKLEQELGADRVINYKEEDVSAVLSAEYPAGVDVVYEGVGGALRAAIVPHLAAEYPHVGHDVRVSQAEGGQPLSEVFWTGQTLELPEGKKVLGQIWPKDVAAIRRCKRRVFKLHQQGKLQAWTDVSHGFKGVEQVLNMSRNSLVSLPPELSCLTALTELDVSRNQLRALPAALCTLTGLKVLNAMANHLVSLPHNFGGLSSIIRLGLKSNKLQYLPESFCQLSNLVELFITDNQLATLPQGFGSLSSLVKLQASFNPFTHLPEDMFQNLRELEMFRLAVGQLLHWPPGLAESGGLPKLAWCSLGSNPAALPVKVLPETLPRVMRHQLHIGLKLGAGASGEVFLGRHQGQEVAVKIFVAGIVSPDGCIQEEMGISCSVDHPHLTKVRALVIQPQQGDSIPADDGSPLVPVAAGGAGDVVGLVLELVHGKPLAAKPTSEHLLRCKWAEEDVFAGTQVLKVCHGIAGALAYLHSQGTCHGDVYAHNILVDRQSGHAVLCDFGASFCYDATVAGRFWQAMEVRAYGLFMQDMVDRLADAGVAGVGVTSACCASGLRQQLEALVEQCLAGSAMHRPTFANIEAQLLQMLERHRLIHCIIMHHPAVCKCWNGDSNICKPSLGQ
eukprot:gene4107-4353_t